MKNQTVTIEKEDSLSAQLLFADGEAKKPITVCFVCTGNTCRSPMAAAALNHLGKGKYRAFSAGLSVYSGDTIAENSVIALEKAGIPSTLQNPYKEHFSVQINRHMIEECDMVIGITMNHSIRLLSGFPEYSAKISALPKDIPDPFMQGQEVYDRCLEQITESIKQIFDV